MHASTKYSYSFEVHQPTLFHNFTLNSMYRKLYPSTICFRSFLPFFFSSAKLGGLRACRLTPPHLMRLLAFVLSNKRLYSLQTIHCFFYYFFLRKCKLNFPACWTCMVFIFFMCLNMSFLSDEHGIHTFIYGLLTFLGQQQKSDRTSHPPLLTQVHFSCVEVHHQRLSLGCSECAMHSRWKLIGGDPGAREKRKYSTIPSLKV